jgi:carbonic anhydrase
MFDDLLAANTRYQRDFALGALEPRAARGLAVVTCIDSRIEPLTMLGLEPGDAKILRNAGARVTDDVLRSLVLATNLLGVDRIAVVPHTNCRMASATEAEMHEAIQEATGHGTDGWEFLAVEDMDQVVKDDLQRLRTCPLLPAGVGIGALLYDVRTGSLTPLDAA